MKAGTLIIKTLVDKSGFKKGVDELKDDAKDVDISPNVDFAGAAKLLAVLTALATVAIGVKKSFERIKEENGETYAKMQKIKDAVANIGDALTNVLVNLILPVVENIVNFIFKMFQYIGYLAKAWFNVDIFAERNEESLKGANKSAQKLKKTLTGFDEMNVVNGGTAGDTAGGGGSNFQLGGLQEGEVPKWLVDIKNIGEWIIDNWRTVVDALLLTKMFIDVLTGNWVGFIFDIIGYVLVNIPTIKEALKAVGDFIVWIGETLWEAIKAVGEFCTWIGETLWNAIKTVAEGFWDFLKWIGEGIANLWNKFVEIVSNVASWVYEKIIKPVGDFFKGLWDGIKDGVKNAVDWIKEKFKSITTFFSDLISKIVGLFKKIGTKVGDAIGGAFKAVINGVLSAIENILNFPIKSINKLLDVINAVPGINISKLSTFNLPRLAVGGIINQPGRGIPVGGAIAGERGREGVLPLTNSQAMEELGAAIGKYITINPTIPIYVGNRQIAREIRKINAENDFAMNR